MTLRCYLSSLLRIHHPDCKDCKAREQCGVQMRERLEELNLGMQPNLTRMGAGEEVVPHFDSKPGEAQASPPTSFAHQMKKTG